MSQQLAINISETFVDAIVFGWETGETHLEKAPATEDDPAHSVLMSPDESDAASRTTALTDPTERGGW